jgi:hypothetical protein
VNLFPVTVITPDGARRLNCKLIYDGELTTIWHWPDGATEPVAIAQTEGQPLSDAATKTHTFEQDGGLVTAAESRSCGCSHRMKTWNPPGSGAHRVFPPAPAAT